MVVAVIGGRRHCSTVDASVHPAQKDFCHAQDTSELSARLTLPSSLDTGADANFSRDDAVGGATAEETAPLKKGPYRWRTTLRTCVSAVSCA